MHGFQLVRIYEEMKNLGLVRSREQFSRSWCGRHPGYLRDYLRREGATMRVSVQTIQCVRLRLAEAGSLLPPDLRDRVQAFDAAILRDMRVADLLGRRSIDARITA